MESTSVVLDRYRLQERIGAGGMGVVWRATDLLLDQPVALKRISLVGIDVQQAELTRARALREARTAARLRHHPHVVATYDVRIEDGDVWLVLEYLPSRSLGALCRERGPLELAEVARIGARVADALAAGHAQGIVHRDVTPGNVLITTEGTVKLTDFGISRLSGHEQITHEGVISGTIAYLAPEVAATGQSTPASDVFSLGSTLYAAIEGQPPFGIDDNVLQLLNVVRTGIIRPPTSAGALTPLLLRLLELDPATRPDAATARDLLDQFAHRMTAATEYLPPSPPPISSDTARPPPDEHQSRAPSAWLARWPRRRQVLTAVLVLITVIAGVATGLGLKSLGGAGHETLVGAPPLPATVGPISLTGDPKAADPCALIDPAWLRQFGYSRITLPYIPSGCRALITTPHNGDVRLELAFDVPTTSTHDSVIGQPQQLGELTIARKHIVRERYGTACENVLILADRTQIYVNAYGGYRFDLCALTEVGTASAVIALDRQGITYRPGRTSDWLITNNDACRLLTNTELSTLGGIDPTVRYPGYANWRCTWGVFTANVSLTFRLEGVSIPSYGNPTTIAGHRAWLHPAPDDKPRQDQCDAIVVSRQAPTVTDATEMIDITVTQSQPDSQICTRATKLAAAAVSRLPTS